MGTMLPIVPTDAASPIAASRGILRMNNSSGGRAEQDLSLGDG
jgi:hypothetical protein